MGSTTTDTQSALHDERQEKLRLERELLSLLHKRRRRPPRRAGGRSAADAELLTRMQIELRRANDKATRLATEIGPLRDQAHRAGRVLRAKVSRCQVRTAWSAWSAHYRAKARAAAATQSSSVECWLNRQLARGFNVWQYRTRETLRTRALEKRVDMRALGERTVRALSRWQVWTAERKRLQRTAARAVSVMRHRKTTGALATWVKFVQRCRVATRALLRLRHARTAKRLSYWRAWTQEIQLESNSEGVSWVTAQNQRLRYLKLLRRTIGQWMHFEMSKCFRTWWSEYTSVLHVKEQLLRGIAHMNLLSAVRSFNRWREEAKCAWAARQVRRCNHPLDLCKAACPCIHSRGLIWYARWQLLHLDGGNTRLPPRVTGRGRNVQRG